MESDAKKAIVTTLMRSLAKEGSWCGETHVQKAVFMLQTLTEVPTGYYYVLYKHGPFSFDLRDELATMRAEKIVELVIRTPDYGPAIVPTANSDRLEKAASAILPDFQRQITFVAQAVGKKGVAELERLATVLYISPEFSVADTTDSKARALRKIKPHISQADAITAVTEAQELMASAPHAAQGLGR